VCKIQLHDGIRKEKKGGGKKAIKISVTLRRPVRVTNDLGGF